MISEQESDKKHWKEVPISVEERAFVILDSSGLESSDWFQELQADIAQALREAEARGMERAAKICDEAHESNFSCELVAEMIRDAAKEGE